MLFYTSPPPPPPPPSSPPPPQDGGRRRVPLYSHLGIPLPLERRTPTPCDQIPQVSHLGQTPCVESQVFLLLLLHSFKFFLVLARAKSSKPPPGLA